MMTKPRPWTLQFRRALTSPGNVIAGLGAILASAVTWNPLPLILYGLGEPVWLYSATTSARYTRQIRDGRKGAALAEGSRVLAWRELQLAVLLQATPCGDWIRRGQLADYATAYARLVALRDQAAELVGRRHDAANALEHDVVSRMDDMLRGYLMMATERLLFHCALAKLYPRLPELPAPVAPRSLLARLKDALVAPATAAPEQPIPWREATPFVSLDAARDEIRAKRAGFQHDLERGPAHADVYGPMIDALAQRLGEFDRRGHNDLIMAAQLQVFPDQFEVILHKLAITETDVGEVVADMKLLLEQTDDTVRSAEATRN